MRETNLDCCVVRDLLPSYLEELTETETSAMVREHIEHCAACRQLEEDRIGKAVTAVQSLHLQNICLHIRMIQSRSQHAFHTLPVKQPERNCRCDGYQCSKHRNFYPIFLIFFQNTVPCHFLIHSAISHDPAQLGHFP